MGPKEGRSSSAARMCARKGRPQANLILRETPNGENSLLTLRRNLNKASAHMKNSSQDRWIVRPARVTLAIATATLLASSVGATDRRFTFTYEPETMPQGAKELEQWITLRTQRTKNVDQENYNAWDFREEFEFGVTDNYQIALYLNGRNESYRSKVDGDVSDFTFEGLSL